jgi:hypothetical protein
MQNNNPAPVHPTVFKLTPVALCAAVALSACGGGSGSGSGEAAQGTTAAGIDSAAAGATAAATPNAATEPGVRKPSSRRRTSPVSGNWNAIDPRPSTGGRRRPARQLRPGRPAPRTPSASGRRP